MIRRIAIFFIIPIILTIYGYLTNTLLFSVLLGIALGLYLSLLDWQLETYSFRTLMGGSVGFTVGLLVSLAFVKTFMSPVSFRKPEVVLVLSICLYVGTYIGVLLSKKWPDFEINSNTKLPEPGDSPSVHDKILDTSVIIDGRIAEIIEIGFLEGTLLIPKFILKELQNMADSGNNLKRNRGRRGLDILNKIREELPINVKIVEKQYPDVPEVDEKLVELAQDVNAKVITNDFNLNKVASLQDVDVLNINDLSNAVKPVYIPGETFNIEVIKEGEEQNQGVGYLEDGTMVVIENAINNVGDTISVTVTSVIQTSAGRMVFAEKGSGGSIED